MINTLINVMLTMLPSSMEIKQVVFNMNLDNAPDPNGFGALFYQTYWDIMA